MDHIQMWSILPTGSQKETSMAYNGWTNYETWNVALWIDNDYGLYQMRQEMTQDCYDNADGNKDAAAIDLAARLQSLVDEMNPLAGDNSMFSDILNSALASVDYREIAENFLEDVEDKEEETEEVETEA